MKKKIGKAVYIDTPGPGGIYATYLNDYGGKDFWHGGPGFPNHHGRVFHTKQACIDHIKALGYMPIN